jgi:DNA-binding NtrC family response regulator
MPENNVAKAHLLIVDDERDHAQVMSDALERLGHRADLAYSLAQARESMARRAYDVVVTDLMMDGRQDGMEVLRLAMAQEPPPPVLLVTAHADVPTCRQALQEGAYDYIEKPLDLEYFRTQVNRAAEKAALRKQNQILQDSLADRSGFEAIIGSSPGLRKAIESARRVAPLDYPVLILGESGTGKELFANAIHNASRRRKNRLVAMNCAAMTESIMEDELFGHVKGAYTDARQERAGRFEHADGGTLFMDEIGDMPPAMQAKLLRVLENGEVVRLGANDPIKVDVRLISATNRNLEEMVAEKQFRQDLYFRIKGVTISIPPLRERRQDIPLLIHYFLQQACARHEKDVPTLTPEVRQFLITHPWPGNVRQLKTVIENMVILASGRQLGMAEIPDDLRPPAAAAQPSTSGIGSLAGLSLEQAERELIRSTLEITGGNREMAARMLGIGERTLYRKIKDYRLAGSDNPPREQEDESRPQ